MDKINYKLVNLSLILIIFFLLFKIVPLSKEVLPVMESIITVFVLSCFLGIILYKIRVKLFGKINKILSFILTIIFFVFILFIIGYLVLPIMFKELLSLKDIVLNNKNIVNVFLEDKVFDILTSFFKISTGFISFIKSLIFVIVLGIFIFIYMDKIIEFLKRFINTMSFKDVWFRIFKDLSSYFDTVFKLIFIEAFEYTFLFLIVGHPNFLLLGFMMGFTSIIPYVGNIITSIVALVISFGISKNLFIFTLVIVLIIPIFDSYLRDPKIYKDSLKLNPFMVILSFVISDYLFGSIGFLIAIPLLIVFNNLLVFIKRKV